MRLMRLQAGLAVPVAAVLALSACSTSPAAQAMDPSQRPAISVVASTSVYGDIAKTVGGDAVSVTSILSDPAADPHSYEANAQTELLLSKAAVVIENGGGYDDFVDTMLHASGNTKATVLNAVDISGKAAQNPADLNEHVFYDFPTMSAVAAKVTGALSKAAPRDAHTFTTNAAAFGSALTRLEQSERDLAAQHAGEGVAITEPVPLYLLQAAGLTNRTPPQFSRSIEDGTDVAPAVLQDTMALFTQHKVAALVYNAQTTGPQTEQVLKAATDNNVAVVPVTETLPRGYTYLSWMSANLAALSKALAR